MTKTKVDPFAKRTNIKEIKAQLDLLTTKLREYESDAARCTSSHCRLMTDGLRLSQEVELLQKENVALRHENRTLKLELGQDKAEGAT